MTMIMGRENTLPKGLDSGQSSHSSKQCKRGQLKISISCQRTGHVIIHVHKAKQLVSRWTSECNAFVKIELIEESQKNVYYQSHTVKNSNQPIFDEKFEVEMCPEDLQKRLLISLWNKHDSQKELLGSMSFGVKQLMNKKMERCGWYYLLAKDLGSKKHLAAGRRRFKETTLSNRNQTQEKSITKEQTIVIKKKQNGFGFCIKGKGPVYVSEICSGHSSGLHVGDAIIRINGHNVHAASAEIASKLIKNSEKQIVLDILRGDNFAVESGKSINSTQEEALQHTFDGDFSFEGLTHPLGSPIAHVNSNNVQREHSISDDFMNSAYQSSKHVESEHDTYRSELSHFPTSSKKSGGLAMGLKTPQRSRKLADSFNHSWCNESDTFESFSCSGLMDSELLEYDETDLGRTNSSGNSGPNLLQGLESSYTSQLVENQDSDSIHKGGLAHFSDDEIYNDTQGKSSENEDFQFHIKNYESEYVHVLQKGIQYFSRPLKYCILTSQQHISVFQNIEKLASLSEFIAEQLTNKPAAEVYSQTGQLLYGAYTTYFQGLESAIQMISSLETVDGFGQFLESVKTHCPMTLREFIQQPLNHFNCLLPSLETIHKKMKNESPHENSLGRVIKRLASCQEYIKVQGLGHFKENAMSITSGSSGYAGSIISGHSKLKLEKNTKVVHVDADVLDFQKRLRFAKGVKKFDLASPNRHMIYSGYLIAKKDQSEYKVRVFLLSDILLVTVPQQDNTFLVIEKPFFLHSLSQFSNENCHPSEFGLQYEDESRYKSFFRAASMEQRCTWKLLLKHRMKICKSQMDYLEINQDSIII